MSLTNTTLTTRTRKETMTTTTPTSTTLADQFRAAHAREIHRGDEATASIRDEFESILERVDRPHAEDGQRLLALGRDLGYSPEQLDRIIEIAQRKAAVAVVEQLAAERCAGLEKQSAEHETRIAELQADIDVREQQLKSTAFDPSTAALIVLAQYGFAHAVSQRDAGALEDFVAARGWRHANFGQWSKGAQGALKSTTLADAVRQEVAEIIHSDTASQIGKQLYRRGRSLWGDLRLPVPVETIQPIDIP